MRYLKLKSHASDEELTSILKEKKTDLSFPKWQVLYLVQVGKQTSAEIIAPLVGFSKHTIYKIIEAYNNVGLAAIQTKVRGGRRRELLSIEQEKNLLQSLEILACGGKIKSAKDIRVKIEETVGKSVSDDFIWDVLKRNGWKKKKPRPHHPKGSTEVREEFKKNSLTYWTPPVESSL